MNPFQYQQQQQLQYPQQYGQQQVQFVPAYPYNIQAQSSQHTAASGQYGGTFTTALSQQPMVGLYTNVAPEAQYGQAHGHPQVFNPTFPGQTQINQTYQTPFDGAYQFQQLAPTNLQSNDAVGKSSLTASSSTSFDPPPMNFPSMNVANNSGGQLSLEDINQKYTEQYQKWQQQYNEWQAQHANHPDQKLFQEYQQQVQQWQQQQQQQMIQAQGMGFGLQSQAPKQTPNQPGQQTHSQTVQNSSPNLSSQALQQTVTHQQFPSMQYQSFSKFSNQDHESIRIDNKDNNPNFAVSSKHEEGKGPNQWQQNQQYNEQGWLSQKTNSRSNQTTQVSAVKENIAQGGSQNNKPNFADSSKHEERKGPNQWQQNQQYNEPGWLNQKTNIRSNQTAQVSAGRPRPELIKESSAQGGYQNIKPNFADSSKHEERKGPNQWQQNQQYNEQGWLSQKTNVRFNQTAQVSTGRPRPELVKENSAQGGNQNIKPNFADSSKHEERKGPNQWQQNQQYNEPGWLSQKTNVRSNQTTQVSAGRPRPELVKEKTDNNPSQLLPKWMQTEGNQSKEKNNTTEIQGSTPKWLQGDAKIPVPDQENKKLLPKWLQDSNKEKIPEQQGFQENVNKQQNKQVNESANKQQKHTAKDTKPLPKWLQGTKAAIPTSTNTEAVTTQQTESSQAQQTSLTTAISTTSSAFSGLFLQRLDPKQELELLQQQSIQLLQLAQLEKKHKESKSADPVSQKPIKAEQIPDTSVTKTQPTSSDNVASQSSPSNQQLITQTSSEHPVQDVKQGGDTDQSTKGKLRDDLQKPQVPSSKLKSVPCRFFPNCRYGAECKFQHPPCTTGKSCTSKDCIFDHSDLPDGVPGTDLKVGGFGSFNKKDVQIPGIGDGSHYVKPIADTEERLQPILKDSTSVEVKNYVPPKQVRDEMGRYPEDRRRGEPDRWHDDDWQRWRNDMDGDYVGRDERLIPPVEEPPPHWNDRGRAYPQNREEWEKSERERLWRENRERSPDWASERDRQHPSRDEEYARWYEDERWKRQPGDWDYPPYGEDRSRPPLSPPYRREPEFDRERYPSREMRDRPYYDRELRNEPPHSRDYEQMDRYSRPLSPRPDDYDRRKEWEDRQRQNYWPNSREPDWSNRRDQPFADLQSDRYREDYGHHRRSLSPPVDPSRSPMYDRQRYRDNPPDYKRRDGYWDRKDGDRVRGFRDDIHPGWRSHQEDVGYQDHHPTREPVQHEKPRAVVVPVETILDKPGRDSRPDRIVIILRGLPGSGKTHVARLVKDKEACNEAHAPRIISLDDYFLTEVEKQEKDPDTGKRIKKKVTEYLYEAEMEDSYRASMFKSFSKTLEDGFFPVVIVDAINNKVEHFEKYWSLAKQKGFEVYIAELSADSHVCAKRNSHGRTFEEISKIQSEWKESPTHMLRLDVRSLLQDAVITEVEMETADEITPPNLTKELGKSEGNEDNAEEEEEGTFKSRIQLPQRSKWDDVDSSAEAQLNKLDGIRPLKRRREASPPLTLSDDEDPYDEKEEDMRIGKKRVRWADIEEGKHMEHRRRIGFCIGTDWSLLTDPNAKIPEH